MVKYKGYIIEKEKQDDITIYHIYDGSHWIIDYPSLALAKEFINVCREKNYEEALRIVG